MWVRWVANRCRAVKVPDALRNAVCPCIAALQVRCLDQVEASVGSGPADGPLEDSGRDRDVEGWSG